MFFKKEPPKHEIVLFNDGTYGVRKGRHYFSSKDYSYTTEYCIYDNCRHSYYVACAIKKELEKYGDKNDLVANLKVKEVVDESTHNPHSSSLSSVPTTSK